MSRRVLLVGGAAAVGAAAATSVPRTATAAGVNPVELDQSNTAKYPTKIKGDINELTEPGGLFTSAIVAQNDNATAGSGSYAVATSYGVNGLASGEGGTGVFGRSEAGGTGVHGFTYGSPAAAAGTFTSGVWGQCSYDESPAFLADGTITLRTLANAGGQPRSSDAKPGDLSIRTDGEGGSTWWVCVKEQDLPDSARFVRVASPGSVGAFEALTTPLRVYDSRVGAPPATGPKTPIVGPAERTIECWDTIGDLVPSNARALVINLTATGTSAAGWAAVFPAGATFGGTSNLNFAAGQTVANSVTVRCGPDASITVRVGEAGVSTNVIIDVMGFYL